MSVRLSSSLLLGFFLFGVHPSVAQVTLTVAAASDLTNLELDLADKFEKTNPGISIRFATGASAMLSQQIQNGAPYDVFLSANAGFLDRLTQIRKIEPKSVVTYGIGRIAVLWRDGKHHPLNDLAENWVRFVALPNPELAPYGVAAQQALEHAHIWQVVRPKVVYSENVRQALQLFDSGNADAVLTANALLEGRNPNLIPADWHQPIVQKAGMLTGTPNPEAAKKFLAFLISPAGQAIFTKFGFSAPKP